MQAADTWPDPDIPRAIARTRRSRILTALLWLVVVANLFAIVGLWVSGGNLVVHHPSDVFDSIGRITGLVGAYLLLIQVVLVSRLIWIEQLVGFDRLVRWHRLNGKITLVVILAHVVFITIGYMLSDRVTLWTEVKSLLGLYPGMIAATIGTGLMVVVVATSLTIVRRRLRYEWWYLVHLTAYVAIVLAWFHQLPTGNEFILRPVADAYWVALYVATLALVAVFRVVQPAVAFWWYGLRVSEVVPEKGNAVSLHITGRHLHRMRVQPGQFFLWRFLARDAWWEAHPFSLSAVPDGKSLRITVKAAGDFTRRIGMVRPGTRVFAEGPFGVFTPAASRTDRSVLIGGGIGITPLRGLLETLPGNIVLLYRVMRQEDIVLGEEIEQVARERQARVVYVIGDHAAPGGRDLLSPRHLREVVPDITERDVFLCGPPGMIAVLERNLREVGVPTHQIHVEKFAL